MTHMCKVLDLMPHGNDIASIITKNKVLLILPDTEHYHVKINKVLTWCGNDEPMNIDLIREELCTYLPGYKNMKQWCIPCWLGNEDTICTKSFTSIVVDLVMLHHGHFCQSCIMRVPTLTSDCDTMQLSHCHV